MRKALLDMVPFGNCSGSRYRTKWLCQDSLTGMSELVIRSKWYLARQEAQHPLAPSSTHMPPTPQLVMGGRGKAEDPPWELTLLSRLQPTWCFLNNSSE